MNAVTRGVLVYLLLLIVFRLSGKRTLSQTTPFEFVLLLIISETIQQALVGNDHSITNGLLLALTLVSLSIAMSLLKQWSPRADKLLDGLPVVLMEKGRLMRDRMDKVRVDEEDILEAGRALQAVERLDQIEYAVLERSGDVTVIPKPKQQG